MKKINFDANLDPDPEWLLICAMCSNTKLSSCHALSNKISHVPFAGPQPDIFVCVCEGGGANWSNFGTFYDYAWIILGSSSIWPFWGRSDDPPDYA